MTANGLWLAYAGAGTCLTMSALGAYENAGALLVQVEDSFGDWLIRYGRGAVDAVI